MKYYAIHYETGDLITVDFENLQEPFIERDGLLFCSDKKQGDGFLFCSGKERAKKVFLSAKQNKIDRLYEEIIRIRDLMEKVKKL